MTTKIIYHQTSPGIDCPDGIASAWVTHKVFPDAEIIGASYQGEMPQVNEGDRLIIVDFSFSAEILESWADKGCEITIIDHHKTALNDLAQLSDRILQKFDMNQCGATLAWRYFLTEEPMPVFLEYVRDRDLWNFELEKTEEIYEAVAHIGRSFALFDALEPLSRQQLIEAFAPLGERLLAPKRQRISEIAKTAEWKKIAGHKVLAVEIPQEEARLASDVCSKLYNENLDSPFVMAYSKNKEEGWNLSFRSNKKVGNFDVSAIARQFGGGGHHNASGAGVEKLPFFVPTIDCPQCGGNGFSGYGSGYDSVCDSCAGEGKIPKD